MAADPQDDADRDEHEKDHRRDQQPALLDPAHAGDERRLDALRIAGAVLRLVRVGLHGADFVDRLVDVRAGVGHSVLARAREAAHAATEQDDRQQDHRQTGQDEQRQLEAREHEQDQRAQAEHDVAQCKREARADHVLEHRRIVGEPGDHLARARDLEETRREREQVIEHAPAQIGGNALTDPRHVVEANVRRDRHHGDDRKQHDERLVELARRCWPRSRDR